MWGTHRKNPGFCRTFGSYWWFSFPYFPMGVKIGFSHLKVWRRVQLEHLELDFFSQPPGFGWEREAARGAAESGAEPVQCSGEATERLELSDVGCGLKTTSATFRTRGIFSLCLDAFSVEMSGLRFWGLGYATRRRYVSSVMSLKPSRCGATLIQRMKWTCWKAVSTYPPVI